MTLDLAAIRYYARARKLAPKGSDTAAIALADHAPKMLAAIEAVFALHKPYNVEMRDGTTLPHCEECSELRGDYHPYPCATVKALGGAEPDDSHLGGAS